ncbi:nuclear hormone receptor family member nhr-66 [Patella vulgata]|uniref:nuclear hormone receptor family member nhr-66 n=1 Tax=Patella vulgata TaxID=6465 RepID=UPI00217F3FFF|nr:nuclear hormone receptor family member nhr-66 [Patella vulgata]
MKRNEKPDFLSPKEGRCLCLVCGDLANGIHFGVHTCEGCKKFFRRCLLENSTLVCKDKRTCPINPKTRNTCRLCRYMKCVRVGMSRSAIKMGRPHKYPRFSVRNKTVSKAEDEKWIKDLLEPRIYNDANNGHRNEARDVSYCVENVQNVRDPIGNEHIANDIGMPRTLSSTIESSTNTAAGVYGDLPSFFTVELDQQYQNDNPNYYPLQSTLRTRSMDNIHYNMSRNNEGWHIPTSNNFNNEQHNLWPVLEENCTQLYKSADFVSMPDLRYVATSPSKSNINVPKNAYQAFGYFTESTSSSKEWRRTITNNINEDQNLLSHDSEQLNTNARRMKSQITDIPDTFFESLITPQPFPGKVPLREFQPVYPKFQKNNLCKTPGIMCDQLNLHTKFPTFNSTKDAQNMINADSYKQLPRFDVSEEPNSFDKLDFNFDIWGWS